jgi:hypothetical protein
MAEERFGIVASDLGRSTIMPSVTVYIPMPPGAALPAQANQPQNAPAPPPSNPTQGSR